MKSLKMVAALLALTLLAQPVQAQQSTIDHSKMDKATMAANAIIEDAPTIVAKVNGLVCDFCAQALKKVFKKEEAVDSLNVDLDVGEVRIGLKSGQTLSDERVAKLIRKSGYSLVETRREGGA